MCSGSEAGSYLRLIDSCITQLKAQGPSRTCNESKEEEVEGGRVTSSTSGGDATGDSRETAGRQPPKAEPVSVDGSRVKVEGG